MSARLIIRRFLSMCPAYALCLTLSCIVTLALAQPPTNEPENQQQSEPPPADQQQGSNAQETEPMPLEEGPIHEAFAEPLQANVSGKVIHQEPPPPIDEVPPAYRPEGENIEWVPGYWMWLEEKEDFIWISGVWRAVPPGRVWTPGYWSKENSGYRWVSGFWSDVQTDEVAYLPYPPESLYDAPTSPAPGEDYFWIPGQWLWRNNNYVWQAGFWYPGQSNWVWVPDHYVYTPRGAVFVDGYWDYPLRSRGLLYAPVYWQGGYAFRRGYAYTPSQLVNTALLLTALFIDRDYGYYYYGWGYGGRRNFYPWYTGYRSGFYSPLYGYYSWQYGRDRDGWKDRFDRRDRRSDQRQALVGSVEEIRASFDEDREQADRSRDNLFRQLSENERDAARQRTTQLERFRSARADFESQQTNDFRARLEVTQRDESNRRQAKVDLPEGYQPSRFNLRSADGASEFRQQAQERYQRYQQGFDSQEELARRKTREGERSDLRAREDLNRSARPPQQGRREPQQQGVRSFQRPPDTPQRGRSEQRQGQKGGQRGRK